MPEPVNPLEVPAFCYDFERQGYYAQKVEKLCIIKDVLWAYVSSHVRMDGQKCLVYTLVHWDTSVERWRYNKYLVTLDGTPPPTDRMVEAIVGLA